MTAEDTKPRRPILLAAALGVVAGGAVVGGIAWAVSGGGHAAAPVAVHAPTTTPATTAATGPTTTLAAPTDPGAKQLVQLLTAGGGLTFHASYTAAGPQFQTKLDLWHRPPLSRRDTDTTTAQGEFQTREVATNDKVVSCIHSGTVPWTCTPTAVDPTKNPGDLTFGNASKFFENITLTPSTTTLSGRAAICFTVVPSSAVPAPSAANRICTTPEGIPLLIDTGQGPITLVTLDLGPQPDSVFTPPDKAVGV